MGVSYTGSFSQLTGIGNVPPAFASDVIAYFPFTSGAQPTYGAYSTEFIGTPTYEPAPNAPPATRKNVLRLDTSPDDRMRIVGDFSFLAGDFTISFWCRINEYGIGTGGTILRCGPIRLYATGNAGNANVSISSRVLDAKTPSAQDHGAAMFTDVNRWNHFTLSKETSTSMDNGYIGTRFSTFKNGSITGNRYFDRFDGTFAFGGGGITDHNKYYVEHPASRFDNEVMHIGGDDATTVVGQPVPVNIGGQFHISDLLFSNKGIVGYNYYADNPPPPFHTPGFIMDPPSKEKYW